MAEKTPEDLNIPKEEPLKKEEEKVPVDSKKEEVKPQVDSKPEEMNIPGMVKTPAPKRRRSPAKKVEVPAEVPAVTPKPEPVRIVNGKRYMLLAPEEIMVIDGHTYQALSAISVPIPEGLLKKFLSELEVINK